MSTIVGVRIENAAELRYHDLRRILGVDAVIRGHLIEVNNFTAGFHAETMIHAKLDMMDLETGNSLWEVDHKEIAYSGIASPTIVDIIQEQVENAKVKQAYYKNAEMFCQQILSQIPDPAPYRAGEVQLPLISSIETNIQANQKLKTADSIYVSMRGQPGLMATFDIGSWRTSIPMKHAKLDMMDLETGNFLWEVDHKEMAYSGIASPTIVDIIQEQVENAKVKQAYYKIAEMFCQQILSKIPDPAAIKTK